MALAHDSLPYRHVVARFSQACRPEVSLIYEVIWADNTDSRSKEHAGVDRHEIRVGRGADRAGFDVAHIIVASAARHAQAPFVRNFYTGVRKESSARRDAL